MEHICMAGKGINKLISWVNIQCFVKQSHWFFRCLTIDTFRLWNQPLPMLPIWAGREIPIRLEVYSSPTRKLHQLTNILISSVPVSKPNFGFGSTLCFWWLQSNKNNNVGDRMYEISSLSNKKCHHVVCIPNYFWDFPGDSVIRTRPANAGDEVSMPGPEIPTCCGATKPLSHNCSADNK